MGVIDDVFKASDSLISNGFQFGIKNTSWNQFAFNNINPNGRTFNQFGLFNNVDPTWAMGTQFSSNIPQFGSLTDNFSHSMKFTTDGLIKGMEVTGKLLERTALVLTPAIGLGSTFNEYQKHGEFNMEVGLTGTKAAFDTALGFAAFLNPAVAIPASGYLVTDAFLGFMGTSWGEVMETNYQRSQQLMDKGVPYNIAFPVGPKY